MSDNIKSFPLHLKRGSLTDTGEFTAYVSTFGPPADLHGDIIEPGAFAPALARGLPAMLWTHDLSEPIGKWLSMVEDDVGLLARGKLTLETRRGAEALALLRDDAIRFSIGFGGVESYQRGGTRIITKVGYLPEVSLTPIPANPRAQLVGLKEASMSKRNLERYLREHGGLSRKQAKSVVAGDWGALLRDERGASKVDRLLQAVDTLTVQIRESLHHV